MINFRYRCRTYRARLFLFLLAVVSLCLFSKGDILLAKEKDHPPSFLPDERRIIIEYFRDYQSGLPPGLAKRGGNLPPGLQKHLQKNGTLPPGLQKRLQPLPADLESRLPGIPDIWGRVVLGRRVILLDKRTNRILDIIQNVAGLMTGQ
ncbi:MAG: hypothetical protein E6J89_13150 [Deltaproteobacteria bacterium]|nr:MAG: hypothetical protein E6J89_13150 [Deltaproteobacteria bacterium]